MNTDEFFDFIIVGAGPAGLTSSISAAKNGFRVLILEKGITTGPKIRGESFRSNPFLTDLLGDKFFTEYCFKTTGAAIYHSPNDLQQFKLSSNTPLFFFEWRHLIDTLEAKAKSLGVTIKFQSEVMEPIENDLGICSGVRYKDIAGNIQEVNGHVFFACDGHQSILGKHYNIPYDLMNCPMVKCLAHNDFFDINAIPDLQFYLIGNGDLEFAPDFPQSVAYMFPIGGKRMELGLMLRMTHAHKMKKKVIIPDDKKLMQVWNRLKEDYPGFSQFFKNTAIEVEETTGLSNAKLVDRFIVNPGIVLIGDSAGFIDPFGSSGLLSGMIMGDFWANLLSDSIKTLPSRPNSDKVIEQIWNKKNCTTYENSFKKTDIYKKIRFSYRLISKFEWYIFKHLRTSSRINNRWRFIRWAMQKV